MKSTIEFEKVTFSYENDYPLFDGLSLLIHQDENIAVMGSSGCGKTTFLHMIAGLVHPSAGRVKINNTSLYELADYKRDKLIRNHFSFIFSSPFLIKELSIEENLLLGTLRSTLSKKEKDLIELFDIHTLLNNYPHQLSSGQQQRVCILRGLMKKSDFILADEPTAHLDKKRSYEVMGVVREYLKEQGRGLVCVTHDPTLEAFFDRIHRFSP